MICEQMAVPPLPAFFVISRVEAASNLHRYDGVKYGHRSPEKLDDLRELYRQTRAEGFGSQPKLRILMGMYVSAAQYSEQYYQRALRVRSMIRADFDAAFNQDGDTVLNVIQRVGKGFGHGPGCAVDASVSGAAADVAFNPHLSIRHG